MNHVMPSEVERLADHRGDQWWDRKLYVAKTASQAPAIAVCDRIKAPARARRDPRSRPAACQLCRIQTLVAASAAPRCLILSRCGDQRLQSSRRRPTLTASSSIARSMRQRVRTPTLQCRCTHALPPFFNDRRGSAGFTQAQGFELSLCLTLTMTRRVNTGELRF